MRKGWEPVSSRVTILVDNAVMELIPNSQFVTRLSMPDKSFICEHGFSALVEAEGKRILIDTGSVGIAVTHNLKLLGINPEDIDLIFLTHGHYDHTGGILSFPAKVIAHPSAFFKRYLLTPVGTRLDLTCHSSEMFIDRVEYHSGPLQLAKGIWTTGEIKRRHPWEMLKIFEIQRDGKDVPDDIIDDQGVIISSKKGLVVISGCGHAGIINTIEQAIELSGINEVYCVIGGFHLIGPGESNIEKTIKELKRLNVKKVLPIHCTGFEGIKKISIEMPEEFEYGTTGCRIDL